MNALKLNLTFPIPLLIALACVPLSAFGGPLLGADLASFTILGASTVTNVPTSVIVGNVGVWSSGGANAITGFNSVSGVAVSDPQVTGGSVYSGTAVAQTAQGQLTAAIGELGSLGSGTTLSPDLTGLILAPGVYTVPAGTTNLSGTLTLNGEGNANAAWVFQMPSTLITSSNSVVTMINAGSGAGVYWDVGSSATIGSNTAFLGNLLALTSITMDTSATDLCGRALASTGAVTLAMNSVASGNCSGVPSGSGGSGGGSNGGSHGGLNGGLNVVTTPGGPTVIKFLPAVAAPEISAATAGGGLMLLFGVLAVVFDRRRLRIGLVQP
ncbi:MAG TPA: ice-binding family protein [Candidatus Binataceae bacterium]|nr:ice-binding family protein [Candidatus Binataceae bacterium]